MRTAPRGRRVVPRRERNMGYTNSEGLVVRSVREQPAEYRCLRWNQDHLASIGYAQRFLPVTL